MKSGIIKREAMYADLIESLLASGAKKATRLEGPKRTIVATRRFYGNKPDKKVIEVLITDGPPNYANQQRQKRIKKTGTLSPKFVLAFPPKKKR